MSPMSATIVKSVDLTNYKTYAFIYYCNNSQI